jgi:hypothetical protein
MAIHHSLGMSVEYQFLLGRLEQLNRHLEQLGVSTRSQLVTFDDGWADVMCLAPHFERLSRLQPVLFLTSAQCAGERVLLPLPRLYEWLGTKGVAIDTLASFGISRDQLKLLSEQAQHVEFDRLGIPRVVDSHEILSPHQIRELMMRGWLVGSHGSDHCDSRLADAEVLKRGLHEALKAVLQIGGVPWLAWPEGRCCERTCALAAAVGFDLQFSLYVESGSIQRTDLIHREIWR